MADFTFTITVEQAFIDGLSDDHFYNYFGHESCIREITIQPPNPQGFQLYDVTLYNELTIVAAGGDVLTVGY